MFFKAASKTEGLCMCKFAECLNKFTNFHYSYKKVMLSKGHCVVL